VPEAFSLRVSLRPWPRRSRSSAFRSRSSADLSICRSTAPAASAR